MPGFDGTGPAGGGTMTGWGRGFCSPARTAYGPYGPRGSGFWGPGYVALVEDAVLVGVSAEVWAGLEAMAEALDGEDSILLGEDGETAGHPYPEETKEIYFGKEVLLCQDLTEQAPGAKAL